MHKLATIEDRTIIVLEEIKELNLLNFRSLSTQREITDLIRRFLHNHVMLISTSKVGLAAWQNPGRIGPRGFRSSPRNHIKTTKRYE